MKTDNKHLINSVLRSVLLLLFVCNNSHAQFNIGLTNEEKQQIIDSLNSKSWVRVQESVWKIYKYSIIEAKEILEQRMWDTITYPKPIIIKALSKMNSNKVHEYALAYIDTLQKEIAEIDTSKESEVEKEAGKNSRLEIQVELAEILFKLDDYSKKDKIMELLNKNPEHPDDAVLSALKYLMKKYPEQYAQMGKQKLEAAISDTINYLGWERINYYFDLQNIFGITALPIAENMFINDKDDGVRISLLTSFPVYPPSEIIPFLKERLLLEKDSYMQHFIINEMLGYYGSPEIYSYLSNLQNSIPNPSLAEYINLQLKYFEVIKPDSSLSLQIMIDSLKSFTHQGLSLNWLDNSLQSELNLNIQNASIYLSDNDSINCAKQIKSFQQKVDFELNDSLKTTTSFIAKDAWKFLHYYAQYILDRLPALPPPGLTIALKSSTGSFLNSGSLQYYEGVWKDAVNNNDGTFTIDTQLKTISLRMTYEYGTQTKSNVTVGSDTVVFQTVNTQVQLKNSKNELMPAPMVNDGMVQYYAGVWRTFGTITDGVAAKELLPNTYSFRMTYAFANKDKQQNIETNPTVVFQTIAANVQLQNSQGNLINEESAVQYYAGAWRDFGTTTNGVAVKELLPNNYSFRMSYAYASKDKQQNIETNPTVIFQTVAANVQLQNSSGNLIDQGTIQYYSGAWRDFGPTTNGVAVKELLPNNYSFRMTYEYVSNDKAQDISTNSTVNFSTILCTISVKDAQNNPVNGALISYYSGAWRQIGNTVNGEITKELLPANLTFRVKYGSIQQDKQQNIGTNNLVEFNLQP